MALAQEHCQVVVAGAGPVGLMAACLLGRAGIDVVVLEAQSGCYEQLKASTLHPPTLSMLEELGLVDTLIDQGLKTPVYHFRDLDTGRTVAFDLSELADVTPYPYRLQCEQFKLTAVQEQALAELANVRVLFSHSVVDVRQDDTNVHVVAATPTGGQARFTGQFLIGADGGSSVVRKSLDVPFAGITYPEKFLTLTTDTRLEEYLPDFAGVSYIADGKQWATAILTPSGWRVLVPAPGELDDPVLLGDDYKTKVFNHLIDDGERVQTTHRTLYRVNQRVAQRYDHGRIALAGDAAHVHNPLGGFGMNSGIHDAWNLCERLLEVMQDGAVLNQALAQYDRQRRTIMMNFVQEQSARNKAYLEMGSQAAHTAQREALENIAADPIERRQYLLKQSMLASREQEASLAS